MRTLGHTEAREGRASLPLDARLQRAWERYALKQQEVSATLGVYDSDDWELFRYARRVIAPLRPTLSALNHHVLMTLPFFDGDEWVRNSSLCPFDFGIFVSAGYQCLPETEIVYDLDTPTLCGLGFALRGKHLIINGRVGSHVGKEMVGRLRNNGEIGSYAGQRMIGHFTNHGKTGFVPAKEMIGCYTNTRRGVPKPQGLRGMHNRSWSIPKARRAAFLHDIENPAQLSYDRLRMKIEQRYA
jgi:hypothetical protein